MTAVAFTRDGATLVGHDGGTGLPVVMQHGLGGSEAQVAEAMPDIAGIRRLTLECRGHGRSAPGPQRSFSIRLFADDVLAFCDARGVERFVAGGISMGAAIALRLAVRRPERVRALILARPAWLFDSAPPSMQPYAEVAAMLREGPSHAAKARFARSRTAETLSREAPDNLASLLGFFDRADPALTADLLAAIATDGPGVSRDQARALTIPTLVIGHGVDTVHRLAYARDVAETIPGARLAEIPPKASDRGAHVAAFQAAVAAFLHDLDNPTEPNHGR